jgi:hypothetical protein
MNLDPITTHPDAGAAIMGFVAGHAADLPEFTRAKILEAAGAPSPVDRYVRVTEALFAAKDQVGVEGRSLAVRLARFTAAECFHDPARSTAIAASILRTAGVKAPEGVTWPAKEEDPEPLKEFVEPAEGEDVAAPGPA